VEFGSVTSEIYRAVLSSDAVLDALVVDLPRPDTDGWISLFAVLREGVVLDDALIAEIRRLDSRALLPAARAERDPSDRRGAKDVVGQAARGARKAILTGTPIDQAASRESLANPAALDQVRRAGRGG